MWLIDATGWTWDYIDQHMTLPRLAAMSRRWRTCPPVSVTLARLAAYIGVPPIKDAEPKASLQDTIRQAATMGIPVSSTLPPDPDLALLDAPLGARLSDVRRNGNN